MEIKLGQPIEGEAHRDAIHVAMFPAEAGGRLYPAQFVDINNGQATAASDLSTGIGLVDPWLQSAVMPGQRVWILLHQNTVTGMRHHWEHPSFDNATNQEKPVSSKEWLEAFANKAGMTYDLLIERLTLYAEYDEMWVEGGSEYARNAAYELEDIGELWRHYESVTGKRPRYGDVPFTCSC